MPRFMTVCRIGSTDMPDCPTCGRPLWRVDVRGPATALLPCGHVVAPETVETSGERTEVGGVDA